MIPRAGWDRFEAQKGTGLKRKVILFAGLRAAVLFNAWCSRFVCHKRQSPGGNLSLLLATFWGAILQNAGTPDSSESHNTGGRSPSGMSVPGHARL